MKMIKVRCCSDICSQLDPHGPWSGAGRTSAFERTSAAANARDRTSPGRPALQRTSGGNWCIVTGDSGSEGRRSLKSTNPTGQMCHLPHEVEWVIEMLRCGGLSTATSVHT